MYEFVDLMFKPFLACLILTGMHAYLGLHVVQRGVIFVDLALAQIAAFGTTVGFLFGWGLHSTGSYLIALACSFVGAALFSFTRRRQQIVPQEALIGIVYAIAAAASIVVLSRAPEGGEELKSLMVGHLLFVDWPEIIKITVLYAVIGLIHYFARRPLLLISTDAETAYRGGWRVGWWDFLFYSSFGFVVTSSTELAGVLLVFSFLIVPAVCGVFLADEFRARLGIGWLCGAVTSICGVALSYLWDLPTGATVVCTFGVTVLICAAARAARKVSMQINF